MQELKAKSSGNFAPTPSVNIRDVKGSFFEGKLLSYKQAEGQYGALFIYEFAIKDTDMKLTVKGGAEVDVKAGETVAVFAPTRLHSILKDVAVGTDLHITYLGKVKAGKKGGMAHAYKVMA